MKEPQGSEIVARKAPVTPRARRAGFDCRLPLEQLILPFLQNNSHGAIVLTGPSGVGKTTALSHLRAVLPQDPHIQFFDEPHYQHFTAAARGNLAIVASSRPIVGLDQFELLPWTIDDCIEYLAAVHRDRCASVLGRLENDPTLPLLDGSPQVLRAVLDRLASDESLASVSDALRRHLWDLLPPGPQRAAAVTVCLKRLTNDLPGTERDLDRYAIRGPATAFLRYPAVQDVLAAEAIAGRLCDGCVSSELHTMRTRGMTREIAAAVRLRPAAAEELARSLLGYDRRSDAMAASILLALDPAWQPQSAKDLSLAGAILAGARWTRIDLSRSDLSSADLSGADLLLSNLTKVVAPSANFSCAKLVASLLDGATFSGANFVSADLSRARAENIKLELAEMRGAKLCAAKLNGAVFTGTGLHGADLADADLSKAHLRDLNPQNADFSNANLSEAILQRVKMRGATWIGARFAGATVVQCDLEGLELPEADFTAANLSGSYLTGTSIHHGSFRGARMIEAGLANIDWEEADLRDADFTGASFHLGSTRSGLVGSSVPCEGSKTGFYTDDYDDQDYRDPEEIRKANLCGADLRGAKVSGTDWYLVDLRGAKYSTDQEEHFAKCGAILHSRVA